MASGSTALLSGMVYHACCARPSLPADATTCNLPRRRAPVPWQGVELESLPQLDAPCTCASSAPGLSLDFCCQQVWACACAERARACMQAWAWSRGAEHRNVGRRRFPQHDAIARRLTHPAPPPAAAGGPGRGGDAGAAAAVTGGARRAAERGRNVHQPAWSSSSRTAARHAGGGGAKCSAARGRHGSGRSRRAGPAHPAAAPAHHGRWERQWAGRS